MELERARAFLYKNARPLDLARWQYAFEGGSREAVLRALSFYQNADGGFGHALEADCWNPESSPVQTWAATRILREIGVRPEEHLPMVQGILRYLEASLAFEGHGWMNTVPSNDAHPHAPWWNDAPEEEVSYNPTASLIGFILCYAEPGSALQGTARRLLREAVAWFAESCPIESMHTAACFVELYEYLTECGTEDVDPEAFGRLLNAQVQHVLTADTSLWATQYVCKPSLFIRDRSSRFYAENRSLCEAECRFLEKTQEADGTWAVTWEWGCYPESWAVSKNWWKSDLIVKNMLFFRNMNA